MVVQVLYRGKDIIIVEKLDELMKQEEAKYHTMILERMLKEEDVKVHISSEVIEIKDNSIELRDSKGNIFSLPHEKIIYAVGLKPDSNRINKFKGLCSESYIIGDASKPDKIREAVVDGDRIGRAI